MYLVAEDPVSGVLVKLPGEVHLSATRADHDDVPEQPAGRRLKTPNCTSSAANARRWRPRPLRRLHHEASFTPWSGNAPVTGLLDVRHHQRPPRQARAPARACRSRRR